MAKAKSFNKKVKNGIEWWMYVPQIVAFGYVPLLVHVYRYYRPLLAAQVWFSDGYHTDLFLAYKAFGIIICGFFALIVFLASLPQYPFKKNKIYIPLGVYALMVLLSGTISPYRSLAWAGSFESFESVPVVLSYCVICFTTAHLISYDGMKGIKTIVYGALPGIFALMLIGAFQYIGKDFFATDLGNRLVLGSLVEEMDLRFNFGPGRTYSTLYNPNFVGAYFCVVTPFLACFSFVEKKIWMKVLLWVGVVLSIVNVIGAGSDTSYVVLICEVGVGIILLAFKNGKIKRGLIATGALFLAGIAAIVGVMSTEAGKEKVRHFLVTENIVDYYDVDIHTSTDGIEYVYNGGSVLFTYEIRGNKIFVYGKDENSKAVNITEEEYREIIRYRLHLPDWDVVITPVIDKEKEIKYISLFDDQRGFNFYKYNGVYYLFNNRIGKIGPYPGTIKKSELFNDGFADGRGILWNLTIPILPKHIMFGSGAGTYIMEYPQEDYKYYKGITLDVKPHSYFLQQWVENSLVALVGVMVFLIWILFVGTKQCIATGIEGENREKWIIVALSLLCTVGFVLSGIMNDSIIVYGIVFWSIIGMGVGMMVPDKA